MRVSGHEHGKRSKIGGWPLATAILAVLVFLFFVRHILTPFVLAATLAFILTPPIDWAQRRLHMPRWLIATVFSAVIIAIVVVPMVLYGTTAAHSMAQVGTQLPQLVHNYVHALANIAHSDFGLSVDADHVSSIVLERGQGLLQSSTVLSAAGYGVGLLSLSFCF
jgi:predicted PurR-regulated permease PerM